MNNAHSTGSSKEDNVYENRAYGIQTVERKEDHAYVEYADNKHRRQEEDGWLSLCIACLMCR